MSKIQQGQDSYNIQFGRIPNKKEEVVKAAICMFQSNISTVGNTATYSAKQIMHFDFTS